MPVREPPGRVMARRAMASAARAVQEVLAVMVRRDMVVAVPAVPGVMARRAMVLAAPAVSGVLARRGMVPAGRSRAEGRERRPSPS